MNQVYFDDIASFDNWGIYLSSLDISDAEPKENYVDIPLGDGSLDLTEALTGEVSYGNRSFEAIFTIKSPRNEWPEILRGIRNYLNGKKRIIKATEEAGYYLIGRCKTSFKKDGVLGMLTVSANCEPWKYKENKTYYNFTIGATGTVNVNCINSRKRVIPKVTVSDSVNISFKETSISVSPGTHRFTNLIFSEGDNQMTITGPQGATIKFEYQEGSL